MIKRWKATIRLAFGLHQVVFVSADSAQKAALLLEVHFGKERLVGSPVLVGMAHTAADAPRQASPSERLRARMARRHA